MANSKKILAASVGSFMFGIIGGVVTLDDFLTVPQSVVVRMEYYGISVPEGVRDFTSQLAGDDNLKEEISTLKNNNDRLMDAIIRNQEEYFYQEETIQNELNFIKHELNRVKKEPQLTDLVDVCIIDVCTGAKQQVKMTYSEYLQLSNAQ